MVSVISEVLELPLEKLQFHHRNPRQGDAEKIAESLEVNGQYRPIVVNVGSKTGREYEVLAGNHTLAAARQLGWETIYCSLVDLDEDSANRVLIADNRTADLASYETTTLQQLQADLAETELGLAGTGFDEIAAAAPAKLNPNVSSDVIRFAGMVIPLSSEERDLLEECIRDWMAETGGLWGFVRRLLDGSLK